MRPRPAEAQRRRERLAPLLLAALALAASSSAVSQPFDAVDAHIASAAEHLRHARFEQAMAEADAGLALLGEPEAAEQRSRAARLDVLAATADLAFGREEAARRRLGRALRNQPGLSLSDLDAPPKLRRALAAVRESRSSEARAASEPQEFLATLAAEPPRRSVPLEQAREALARSLRALAGGAETARIERWEIRPDAGPTVWVEVARQRIGGRLHQLEHVRVAGQPEAELRRLSIESSNASGTDRILFHPASGRARRLAPSAVELLAESVPLSFDELTPPRLADFELLAAWVDRLDGEPVRVIEARPLREPDVARVELVVAVRDGALLGRRWYRAEAKVPFRILRAPRWAVHSSAAGAAAREWLLFDLERPAEATLRLVQRIADPGLDPAVFTLARLRGASAPIPIPEDR